jgi:uncharacterized membrane protein YgaE (UPF0421/DUF939 family)
MLKGILKGLVVLLLPVLKDILKKMLREFSDWIISKIKDILQRQKTSNVNKAQAKADEASEKARTSKTQDEVHQHEVAEMFRQENESLKAELELLQRNSEEKTELAVASLSFENAIDSSVKEFKVIEGQQLLQLEERKSK